MAVSDLEISVTAYPILNGDIMHTLATEHGTLDAYYQPHQRWLGIAMVDVEPDYQCKGIAKALMRKCIDIAEEKDVKLLHALIISRECLDAMVSVFGSDAVSVRCEGSYVSDPWPTSLTIADLKYKLV